MKMLWRECEKPGYNVYIECAKQEHNIHINERADFKISPFPIPFSHFRCCCECTVLPVYVLK